MVAIPIEQGLANGCPVKPSSVLYRQLKTPNTKIVRSQGVYLIDESGFKIIDGSGGAAVSCIGHNQKQVHKAIMDQLEKVEYAYSFYFTTPVAEELAHIITESTGGEMSRVYVVSSGIFHCPDMTLYHWSNFD